MSLGQSLFLACQLGRRGHKVPGTVCFLVYVVERVTRTCGCWCAPIHFVEISFDFLYITSQWMADKLIVPLEKYNNITGLAASDIMLHIVQICFWNILEFSQWKSTLLADKLGVPSDNRYFWPGSLAAWPARPEGLRYVYFSLCSIAFWTQRFIYFWTFVWGESLNVPHDDQHSWPNSISGLAALPARPEGPRYLFFDVFEIVTCVFDVGFETLWALLKKINISGRQVWVSWGTSICLVWQPDRQGQMAPSCFAF